MVAGALEDAIRALPGVSEAYRHEQLGALGCVREAFSAACRLGLGAGACMAALEVASVDVSRTGPSGAGAPRGVAGIPEGVFVCDRERAAALPARSCDALVLCDMTSANWPVADREDAGDALSPSWACIPPTTPCPCAPHVRGARVLPSRELVVERCLFDAAAEPTYPAMVVEELVDCYRDDPAATDDIDNPYALPPALREGLVERGEERLGREPCRLARPAPRGGPRRAPRAGGGATRAPGAGGAAARGEGRRRDVPFGLADRKLPACPCLWFVQRRLRVQPLDEEFGPLQMGDFAHHALEGFYRAFWERTGARKVGAADAGRGACRPWGEVLAAQQALQPLLKPSDNRLVPTSELEVREMDALKARLVRYLDFEAQLLPGFHPRTWSTRWACTSAWNTPACGWWARWTASTWTTRGMRWSSTTKARFRRTTSLPAMPRRRRARAARRTVRRGPGPQRMPPPGARPACPRRCRRSCTRRWCAACWGSTWWGALYVCYGREPRLAGAYDARVLETPHLPNMRHARCACLPEGEGSFASLLDATERRAAQAVRALLSGEVNPAPAGPSSCTWCPVSSCAWREGR